MNMFHNLHDRSMNSTLQTIPIASLALAFLPVFVVVAILYRWSIGSRTALYAVARMLIQLLLVGYVLAYIFEADQPLIVIGVLIIMLVASSCSACPIGTPGASRSPIVSGTLRARCRAFGFRRYPPISSMRPTRPMSSFDRRL